MMTKHHHYCYSKMDPRSLDGIPAFQKAHSTMNVATGDSNLAVQLAIFFVIENLYKIWISHDTRFKKAMCKKSGERKDLLSVSKGIDDMS